MIGGEKQATCLRARGAAWMVSSWSFEVPTLLRQSLGDGEAQAMLPRPGRPPRAARRRCAAVPVARGPEDRRPGRLGAVRGYRRIDDACGGGARSRAHDFHP